MTGPFMFRSGWMRARLNSVKQPVAKAIEARDVVGLDPQIRRVGGGQVAGKADCVRRAPTIAAESDATDEPDEEDQGEVATPPFVQGGAQVVRRDVPCSAHGREPPADHRVSPPLAVSRNRWLDRASTRIEGRGGRPLHTASC